MTLKWSSNPMFAGLRSIGTLCASLPMNIARVTTTFLLLILMVWVWEWHYGVDLQRDWLFEYGNGTAVACIPMCFTFKLINGTVGYSFQTITNIPILLNNILVLYTYLNWTPAIYSANDNYIVMHFCRASCSLWWSTCMNTDMGSLLRNSCLQTDLNNPQYIDLAVFQPEPLLT